MILPFSTKLNGKPTYFVEKIWRSLEHRYAEISKEGKRYLLPAEYFECLDKGFENMKPFNPKLHTIREDKKDRWKPGTMIDFFINARTKNMFRFAARIPVISTQKVTILWYRIDCNAFIDHKYSYKNRNARIYIDGNAVKKEVIEEIARNDGFDNTENFFEYFNENFTGKIIHWTDKKY